MLFALAVKDVVYKRFSRLNVSVSWVWNHFGVIILFGMN